MVKLIRNNKVVGYLLLAAILVLTKYSMFHGTVLSEQEFPFLFRISGLSLDIDLATSVHKWIVIGVLFAQGLVLQWIMVRHRFVDNGSPLIPFLYVFSALILPDHFYFNDGLWINFVILYLVNIVIGAYEKERLRDVIFLNIGTAVTIAILVLPSMWVLLLYVLIALSLFVVITDRQIWLVLLSSAMIIVFSFSLLYLTDNLDLNSWSYSIWPSFRSPDLEKGVAIVMITVLFFSMISVMSTIPMLQLRANKIRNQYWTFVLLYLFALVAIFLYPDTRYINLQFIVVPFSAILSFLLLNSKSRWFYEGIFILTIWCIYIVGVGYLV